MLKIRFSYTRDEELKEAVETLRKSFDIIYLNEDVKGKNPKYANSKYKMAYADLEAKVYEND